MASFVLRRLLQMVPLLLGVTFLTFAIVNLVPGSPIAHLSLSSRLRPEAVARIERNLGLDQPWPVRYLRWLGDLLRGDLGLSLTNGTPVADRILTVLPNTLLLTTTALAFALLCAGPLGIAAAARRNSGFDRLVTIGSVATYALPIFWLGLLLILLFAVKFRDWGLPALPIGKTHDLRGGGGFLDRVEHLILPALTLGLVQLAGWTRYVRSATLEALQHEYVVAARAKGLAERSVLLGHAFRSALIPLVTLVGLTIPELFAGAVITETLFAWNGLGRLSVEAAQGNDHTLVMGTVLMLGALTMLANLGADVACALLDPRIREEG
jgi:peptide/nickel transport system permease protein